MIVLSKRDLSIGNCVYSEPLIVKLSSNRFLPDFLKEQQFYICKDSEAVPTGFLEYICTQGGHTFDAEHTYRNVVQLSDEFSYLMSGDVIRFNPRDSSIRVVYRRNSSSNYFLITERCNSYCLMCSQPPRNIEDDYRVDDILKIIPLIDRQTKEIGLSGGEPTLIGDRLVFLIKHPRRH